MSVHRSTVRRSLLLGAVLEEMCVVHREICRCRPRPAGHATTTRGGREYPRRRRRHAGKLRGMPAETPREWLPTDPSRPDVEIRRSGRRKKTVAARWEGEHIVLLAPRTLSRDLAEQYVSRLLPRLMEDRRRSENDPSRTDAYLAERAEHLAAAHLNRRVKPREIRWVTNQNTRWGSTTPSTGTIRISHHLQGVPEYVLDYVIHHELCHLIESSHDARFKRLEAQYPEVERAKSFLDGMIFARSEQ